MNASLQPQYSAIFTRSSADHRSFENLLLRLCLLLIPKTSIKSDCFFSRSSSRALTFFETDTLRHLPLVRIYIIFVYTSIKKFYDFTKMFNFSIDKYTKMM